MPTDGTVEVSVTVRNTGPRDGTEVVQLYLHHESASVVRPVVRLIGFQRITLAPGSAARVTFAVPASVTSFLGADLARSVEPGVIELRLARSSTDRRFVSRVLRSGPPDPVDHRRDLHCRVTVVATGDPGDPGGGEGEDRRDGQPDVTPVGVGIAP